MKIILIRQAEPDMPWDRRCSAAAFEQAAGREAGCGAVRVSVKKGDASRYRVYTGTTPAALDTAEMLFELREPPVRTPLLDEPVLRAFRDTEKTLPLWMWRELGRAQWYAGNGRQNGSRRETLERAAAFADLLEAEDRDCVVICRGLTLSALKTVLRRRGYCIEGGGLRTKPLERLRAVKQSLHCGGCHHNCLLSDAKCPIGQNKARERQNRGEKLC